jgi:hypothetical protein
MDEWLVREAGEYQQAERMGDSQREERGGINNGCESVPGQIRTKMDAIDISSF